MKLRETAQIPMSGKMSVLSEPYVLLLLTDPPCFLSVYTSGIQYSNISACIIQGQVWLKFNTNTKYYV